MTDLVHPLLVLQARAEARAILWHVGELTLQDAVDGCQQHALAHGLVAEHGQDEVQTIIAAAFAPFNNDVVPDLVEEPAPSASTAASTIAAAEYLFRQGDLQRWRSWLAKHSEAECAAILKRIERRRQT